MTEFPQLTSIRNDRVKLAGQLQDKRYRQREARFVIDSIRDLRRALVCGYQVDTLFFQPDAINAETRDTIGQLALQQPDAQIFDVTAAVLAKAAYRENPSGVVAICHSQATPHLRDTTPGAGLHLVLVGLKKPGNIGALLRTAAVTGCAGVVLVDTDLDRYNPNIIRASTGACFLPFISQASSSEAIEILAAQSIRMLATSLEATTSFYSCTLTDPTAIVLGTEDTGLPDVWLRSPAVTPVILPMHDSLVDSLNVSVTGAVIMYEAYRQRLDMIDFSQTHST